VITATGEVLAVEVAVTVLKRVPMVAETAVMMEAETVAATPVMGVDLGSVFSPG